MDNLYLKFDHLAISEATDTKLVPIKPLKRKINSEGLHKKRINFLIRHYNVTI